MKRKKFLALALAGVLMLTLLTGCSGGGGSTAEDRFIAEAVADIFKRIYPNTEVSYGVPELTSTIQPAFTPDWFQKDGAGGIYLDPSLSIGPGQTLYDFLSKSLKDYFVQSNYVGFFVFDSTEMSAGEQAARFDSINSVPQVGVQLPFGGPTPTKLRVGVCHKTVAGREYCLVVVVGE